MGFQQVTELQDLRVLALIADPLELGPDETLTLTPVVHVPAGETVVDQGWTFCPFSLGPQAGYACAVPQCERAISPADASGAIAVSPGALALECLGALEAGGEGPPAGAPDALPESLEVFFTYRVEDGTGLVREAIARPTVWPLGVPEPRNRAPVIRGVDLDGTPLRAGEPGPAVGPGETHEIRVQADPESFDRYLDALGEERLEEPIWSFFATAGELDSQRLAGLDATMEFKTKTPPEEAAAITLYVVLRDLRGGQAVGGPFALPLDRPGGGDDG